MGVGFPILWGVAVGFFVAGGWLSLLGFCALSGVLGGGWQVFRHKWIFSEWFDPWWIPFVMVTLFISIGAVVTRFALLFF